MFKKLKDKITEEVKSSPHKVQQLAQAVVQGTTGPQTSDVMSIVEEGKDNFSSISLHGISSPSYKSRRNSNSSLSSEVSFLPSFEAHGNLYHLQSDLDVSASEVEDNYNAQLERVSKEQLLQAYKKMQIKYNKYRGRYTDLANHYRVLEHENGKMKSVLVETQDKAFRRVSELQEQCNLEQSAKAHIENILREDLNEKQYLIDALNTKVQLLQNTTVPVDELVPIKLDIQEEVIKLRQELIHKTQEIERLREFEKNNNLTESKINIQEELNNKEFIIKNLQEKLQALKMEQSYKFEKEMQKIKLEQENELKIVRDEMKKKIIDLEEKMQVATSFDSSRMNEIQQELLSFKKTNADLEQQLVVIENTNKISRNEVTELQNDITAKKIIISSLEQKIKTIDEKKLEKYIEQLRNELGSKVNIINEQLKIIGDKEAEVSEKNAELQLAKNNLKELMAKLKEQSKQNAEVLEQNQQLSEKFNAVSTNLKTEKIGINEKQNKINDLETQLLENDTIISKLEEEKRVCQSKLSSFQNANADIKQKLNKMIKQNEILESEIKTESQKYIKIVEENTYLKNTLKAVSADLQTVKNENEDLNKHLVDFQKENEALKKQLTSNEKKINETQKLLENATKGKNELQQQLAVLQTELQNQYELKHTEEIECFKEQHSILFEKAKQELIEMKETELETLRITHTEAQNKIHDYEKVLKEYNEEKEMLINQIDDLKKEKENLHLNMKKHLEDLRVAYEKLNQEKVEKENLLSDVMNKKAEFEEEVGMLKGKVINEIMTEQVELKKHLDDEIKSCSQQKIENEILSMEIVKLQGEIREKKMDYETQITKYTEEMKELKQITEVESTKYNEEKKRNDELMKDKLNLENTLVDVGNSKETECKKLLDDINYLKSKLEECDEHKVEENKRLLAENHKLNNEIVSLTSKVHEMRDKTSEFEKKLSIQVNLEKLKYQLEESQKETSDAWNEKIKLAEKLKDLQIHVESKEQFINELEKALKIAEKKLCELTEETEELKEKSRQCNDELDEFKTNNSEPLCDFDEFKDKADGFKKDFDQVVVDNGYLKNSLREVTNNLEETKKNSENSKVLNEQINGDIDDSEEKLQYIKEIQSLIEKLTIYENIEESSKVNVQYLENEIDKLRNKNEKLKSKLDETLVTLKHCADLSTSTEMEYLRNILYNYMIGKESIVLARVIAAVCKFDAVQTETILQKEQQKQTLLGQLGIL